MRVLFLCIGNQGRSQMAHAFLERRGGHDVRSAGSHAGRELHPEVVEAMGELGIDLSDRRPRQLEPDADAAWADVVVTMGCGDVCPHLPGREHLDWPIPDPIGGPRRSYQRTAEELDDLTARLARLLGKG